MTDCEPGTVAVATVRGVPNVRVVRVVASTTPPWMTLGDSLHPEGKVWHGQKHVTDVRPLIVLDLEPFDPSKPATGLRLYGRFDFNLLADQIEAQTKPPKPAEPTGLGAVVEDAEGVQWVRLTGSAAPWRHSLRSDNERPWRYFHDIDAVKVLSEGVTV